MHKTSFLIALLLVCSFSCSHDTTFTLSSTYGDKALVAQDPDTIERMIDCGITRDCDRLSVRALLAQGKVFLVDTGTKVTMRDGFTLSRARRIRVLEGEYAGRTGWIYERMVRSSDRSNPSPQLALAVNER
jgi:hypothetical protein